MVQRINLDTTDLVMFLQEHDLFIPHPNFNLNLPSRERFEFWMFNQDELSPKVWQEEVMTRQQAPAMPGQPLLLPTEAVVAEEAPEPVHRFPLAEELGARRIRQLIQSHGLDILAWYKPFHMPRGTDWGISILDAGIWYLARHLAEHMGVVASTDETIIRECRDIAATFLYQHEMFHFKVELTATYVEQAFPGSQIYSRYWMPSETGAWFGSEIRSNRAMRAPLEEALANAYALHKTLVGLSTTQRRIVRRALLSFVADQPDGYKHAGKVPHGGKKWNAALSELIDQLLNSSDREAFDPRRLLAEQILFDGPKGADDWIESSYGSMVPCRILTTGFAFGRFARSSARLRLGEFCMTKKCEKEYRKSNSHIQRDLQKAIEEREADLHRFKKSDKRDSKKLSGKWNTQRGVREFKLSGGKENWRIYHEDFDGEKVLLRMHKKTDGKQETVIAIIRKMKQRHQWNVTQHNGACKSKQ